MRRRIKKQERDKRENREGKEVVKIRTGNYEGKQKSRGITKVRRIGGINKELRRRKIKLL